MVDPHSAMSRQAEPQLATCNAIGVPLPRLIRKPTLVGKWTDAETIMCRKLRNGGSLSWQPLDVDMKNDLGHRWPEFG
jgi:hypothetical protein